MSDWQEVSDGDEDASFDGSVDENNFSSAAGLEDDDGSLLFEDLNADAEEEEEDVILTSPSLPLVKDVMKRIIKTSKLLKSSKEKVESFRSNQPDTSGGQQIDANRNTEPNATATTSVTEEDRHTETTLQHEGAVLIGLQILYDFLWGRLLRLLNDEHDSCTDVYMNSLDMEDRVPFESLTHAIHHNSVFCDGLGEVVDLSFEHRPYEHENFSDEQHSILREFYKRMEKTQLTATGCALLIVDGSKESFLDPITMYDLCKTVANEPNRRKRLVPLSLMFSMLDQDESAVAEALAQGTPRLLLQRLRHLAHRIFGHPPEGEEMRDTGENHRSSPQRYRSAVIGSEPNSRLSSRRASPETRHAGSSAARASPLFLSAEVPSASTRGGELQLPDSPIPARPAEGVSTAPTPFPAEGEVKHKRMRSRGESPLIARWRRVEDSSHARESWTPRVGDQVGRGPGWRHGQQGRHCDFGEVVGLTDKEEVLVRWIPSGDAGGASTEPHRIFRYSYVYPVKEVAHWDEYLRAKTMSLSQDDLRMHEFMAICAVIGILCQQKDTILPALQFQTVDTMIQVLDTFDLIKTRATSEKEIADAESQEKYRLGPLEEDGAVDEDALRVYLSWNARLQSVKRAFRDDVELIARVGWVLNALLSHRKLALLFLDADGARRVLKITSSAQEVSTIYGCCIVLSHLAKTAVFEELLRRHQDYFDPIMKFIMNQWQHSTNADVQGSAGIFIFYALSFPCALGYFDNCDGPVHTVDVLDRCFKTSQERFDLINPGLHLTALKILNSYLIVHLMLSTKVIFRKHRILSTAVTQSSALTSLPRDPATVDAVLGFLSAPSPSLPDVSADNVQSLLTPDRLTAFQRLIDKEFHTLVLRCANFYYIQSRWELLTASLQVLCVLTVVPFVRPLIVEARSPDSGIAQLLMIVNDLSVSYHNGNASRESHLIPCVVAALQVLIDVTAPPTDTADESAVALFNHACGAFRASDGVRILLEVLKIKKDISMSAKLTYFPVVARAVQLMVTLRRYGDTSLLFKALAVHRVAQELLQQYGDVQREYISIIGPRKLHTELDPAGHFMENVKCFMPSAFGTANQAEVVKPHSVDPLEMEQRQTIIGRAVVDYSADSLLTLIARHLEAEGLMDAARALRAEAHLQSSPDGPNVATADPSHMSGPTLDLIVRSYLRQQQERCPNPIETLPQFDLTKKHAYLPLTAPPDETRNVFNRLLARRSGSKFSLRMQINENCLTYRNPAFMFDITGGDEGLQGESAQFCDDGDTVIIGTSEGAIALFDTFPEEATDEKLLEQHLVFENESITSIVVTDDGALIAAVNEGNRVKIMPRRSLPVVVQELSDARTVRFSHDSKWVLTTNGEEHSCCLYDLNTRQELRRFSDRSWSGENLENVALFDATSNLVLNDAILWDVRCNDKPIIRFDRITESFASAFHPSNLLVMIDEKVWDLRSQRMVQTVPTFQKTSSFHMNRAGRAIYSFREASSLTKTVNPIISAVDSYSFEVVFSEEVRPPFKTFALDPSDRYCAAILEQDMESVIRLFSTASGPYPDHGAFTSPGAQEEPGNELGEDEEEEAVDEWSMDNEDFDDEYDDDEDDDESESSVDYNGETLGEEEEEEEEEEEDEEEDEDVEENEEPVDGNYGRNQAHNEESGADADEFESYSDDDDNAVSSNRST